MAQNMLTNALFAWGSVVGATGAALASSTPQFTPARTGAGVYTLTFAAEGGIDGAQCVCMVTARGATYGVGTLTHTSDTVKTVRLFDAAGAAADVDFDVFIMAVP